MKMEALWAYQQRDMEADRFETEMRQAPNRLKLLKETFCRSSKII